MNISEEIGVKRSTLKSNKPNKKKQKKCLMFFRGPQQNYEKINEDKESAIKQSLIKIMNSHPNLKLHQVGDQKTRTTEEKEAIKLSHELIFGLNSVIRNIESKSVVGVIINDPLAIQLKNNIIELCIKNQIPFICLNDFSSLKTYFNISSLSAMALKPNVTSSDAIFNQFYHLFMTVVSKCESNLNLNPNLNSNSNSNPNPNLNSHSNSYSNLHSNFVDSQSTCDDEKLNEKFDEIVTDSSIAIKEQPEISEEILYTKTQHDNYIELVNKKLTQLDDLFLKEEKKKKEANDIVSQKSFISLRNQKKEYDIYFPKRDSELQDLKVEIIFKMPFSNNNNDEKTEISFVESLIDISVNEKQVNKRKKSQEPNSNKKIKIKNSNSNNKSNNNNDSEIVCLEPSQDKSEKKRKLLETQTKTEYNKRKRRKVKRKKKTKTKT